MKLNNFILIVMLVLCCILLTGCTTATSVETKAYVIALGIDSGESNTFKISFQVAVLSNPSSNGSSDKSNSSTIISVDCTTLDSGISLLNSYISKKVNLSHCKVVILSEELAVNGVSDIVYSLINNIEIRPDCNIIISRANAYDMLKNSKPIFESNYANYYELILNSSEYTGYVADLTLSNFYSDLLSTTSEACAILGGINTDETHSQNTSTSPSLDDKYMADDTPIKSKNNLEILGTAVFRGDKLVGELTNLETLSHLIITNKLESANINIPNPFDFNANISVYISLNKRTKNSVEIINNYPYIESEVFLIGNISSIDGSIDLTKPENIKILNNYINEYIETNILSYLYKTSHDLKSDIAEFGKYLLPSYYTWNDWVESDWLNNFQNSFFKVTVKTQLQSGYIYTKI